MIKSPPSSEAFEDAEVMTAVDEIAKDPSKMIKYKENKKVGSSSHCVSWHHNVKCVLIFDQLRF